MNESVLLIGEDLKDLKKMSLFLERISYTPVVVSTLEAAAEICSKKPCRIAVLDLDSVVSDNRTIRDFKRRFPRVNLIITSVRRFHPELKEAITDHVYACLTKPVDSDEFAYWLTSIHQNGTRNRDGPARI